MKKTLIRILRASAKALAALTIKKFKPTVIAVTGSVGKTSAKEAIYAALADAKRIRKSSANFNNELGVPLTVLGNWQSISKPAALFWLRVFAYSVWNLLAGSKGNYPEIIVLEYGADKPGDISHLMEIARPDIGVVTGIGTIPVHVENYPTGIEAVVKEKGKLISLLPATHVGCMNADDPFFDAIASKSRAQIQSYGFSEKAEVRIVNFSNMEEDERVTGISFKIQRGGAIVPFHIRNVFSVSHAYAVACAIAVADEFGINAVDVAAAIERGYRPVYGRSVLLEGVKDSQIIDESYNSSPLALETALRTLKNIGGRRRIAVLGDMLELGNFTVEAHEGIGKLVPYAADILITVGQRARFIAQKAEAAGMRGECIFSYDEAPEAGKKLQQIIKKGDLVLVKGSRSIGLDAIVEEIREM